MKSLILILFTIIISCFLCDGYFNAVYNADATEEFIESTSHAVHLIQQYIILKNNVNIKFEWEPLARSMLGTSSYVGICQDPFRIFIFLPPALYTQKYGSSGNCASYDGTLFIHMTIIINSDLYSSLYFGLDSDNIPTDKYDVVTIAMHEIIHGLGMYSQIIDKQGNLLNAPFAPLFDWLVFSSNIQAGWPSINGNNIALNNPAVKNAEILKSNLYFNSNHSFLLYTPQDFQSGVSIAHTNIPDLMFWKSFKGQSMRTPSGYIIEMLKKMGYNTINCDNVDWSSPCANCNSSIPCYVSASSFLFSFFDFLFKQTD